MSKPTMKLICLMKVQLTESSLAPVLHQWQALWCPSKHFNSDVCWMQCSESLAASVQCEVYLSLVWPVCDMNSIGRVVSFIRIQCLLCTTVKCISHNFQWRVSRIWSMSVALCLVQCASSVESTRPDSSATDTLRKTYVAMSGVIKFKTVFCLRKIKVFAQLDFVQSGILHIIMLHFHKSN